MAAPWREEWLELAKAMGKPPALPANDPEAMTAGFNAFMVSAVPCLPPADLATQVYDKALPNNCNVRVYTPSPTATTEGNLPLVLFIHGGGFFAGNLDTEDYTCHSICSGAKAIVVSVDFRTGWTLPVKHSVEDCFNAFQWAYEQASHLGADPTKYIICGGSAGAAIGTATISKLIKSGFGDRVKGFVSMNGVHVHPDAVPNKYAHLMTSDKENAGPLPFVTKEMNMMRYEVLNMQPPHTDVELFPVAGGPEYLKEFPRTFCITSENDSMRDDGTVFIAELRDAGVEADLYMFKGLAHYFWHFPLKDAGREFREKVVDGIRWTLIEG